VSEDRQAKREAWNKPNYWPLILIGLFLMASLIPAVVAFRKRERSALK
jgi:hypothetical protein